MKHISLGWKLLLSYIIVIGVGVLTLVIAAELVAPVAIERHMNRMGDQTAGMMHQQHEVMSDDLRINISRAINEVVIVAAVTSILTALTISTIVARRIITPIQQMQDASQRIAAGDYSERMSVTTADELGVLAESFNAMASALEKIETRRRQLIGDVAHELRTPLANVRMMLEGIVDGVLDNSPATLLTAQDEVRRLQRLVADLEQLSKAESGQLLLEKRRVTPHAFVQAAVGRVAWQYEAQNVALQVALPEQTPSVVVDVERMTQVMLNLLGNALQYTPEGGVVRVSAEIKPITLEIAVIDNGIGLTSQQCNLIFERFYRVDKSRTRASGGSGIGLTISKHIVEAHAGSLRASSRGVGHGSTFTITLPRA